MVVVSAMALTRGHVGIVVAPRDTDPGHPVATGTGREPGRVVAHSHAEQLAVRSQTSAGIARGRAVNLTFAVRG